ncbi:hypothetical protein QOZ80_9BG0693730 [Eleusine coracana subsp. coracana]|nr:hypothetical protein QOZ80_9BG0693730 [Eleusine coracana subsp. coracana]
MAAAAPARGGAAQVGVGESSSPPRGPSPAVYASGGSGSGGGGGAGAVGGGLRDVFREVFERLVADGHAKTLLPDLRARLETHFARLPTCYQLDVNIDKEEHVLVRLKVLAEAKDLNKHSAFTVCVVRLEEINADEEPNSDAHKEGADTDEALFTRLPSYTKIHEIILSTTNKPKALSQDTDGWYKALESSILRKEGSWSASYSASASSERSLLFQVEDFKSDIDTEPLKIVKRSLADLVGILVRRLLLKSLVLAILLNGSSWNEFKQEILMLREADYPNSVQFIASCTKPPVFYIFTECMSRENLFDFLHNEHNFLDFPTVLKFAPDICRGMSYLQEKRNVHGDLKSANHLLNKDHVVKVADFGLAHFQDQKGAMTAETETYRWMAPEMPNTNMAPVQAVVDVRKELHPQLPENAYPRLLNMMRICWEPIPSDRPSFSDIIAELQDIQAQAQGAIKSERQDLNYMGGEETSSFAPKTQVFIELPPLSNNCIYEPNGSGAFFLTRNYNTHAPEYSMVNFNGRQYQLFQCDNGMDLMVPKYLENFTADLLNVLIKENFDIRDLLKVFACSTCCMGDPESSSSSSSDDSSKIRRWDDESSSLNYSPRRPR